MTNALIDEPSTGYHILPIDTIVESPRNPRKHFDRAKLEELASSVREHGVLTPLLARITANPECTTFYELAAGHRRFRAAKIAGLTELPVVVREMTDTQLLEILTIENLQRDDVHPLEEAQGYKDLIDDAGYSAARIGERVGKSEKYVYDRIKLLQLAPEAKTLFMAGRITAGHAILLARLKKEDQARALDPKLADFNGSQRSALWQSEYTIFSSHGDDEKTRKTDPYHGLKVKSVRELSGWIDEHVRIDLRRDLDPLLFPELTEVMADARDMNLKFVPVTHEHFLKDSARDEEKTFGPQSWERADGKHGSKKCEYSIPGYVAAGRDRGEAFAVCIAKHKCSIHWKEHVKKAEQRKREQAKVSASAGAASPKQKPAAPPEKDQWQLQQDRRDQDKREWVRAEKQILDASFEAFKKASLKTVVEIFLTDFSGPDREAQKLVGRGATAESILRWLAFGVVYEAATNEYGRASGFREIGKLLKVDAGKILKEVNASTKPKALPAKKKARR